MSFSHPTFLLGLFALAIPIAIHLLARPKVTRIPFTTVDLLIQSQSQSRTRRHLSEWLLLFLRCGIIAAIVLAFADPSLPAKPIIDPTEPNPFTIASPTTADVAANILVLGADSRQTFLLTSAFQTLAETDSFRPLNVTTTTFTRFDPDLLNGTDLLIVACPHETLRPHRRQLAHFLHAGRTIVFFLDAAPDPAAQDTLFTAGILPARCLEPITTPAALLPLSSTDSVFPAAAALTAQRPHELFFARHHRLIAAPAAQSAWPFTTSAPFLCVQAHGPGRSILINTSIDNTLSEFTQSTAFPPFCRLLLDPAAVPSPPSAPPSQDHRPLWRYLIIAAIIMTLTELAFTNRRRR